MDARLTCARRIPHTLTDDGASGQLAETWTINICSNTDEAMVTGLHY